MAAAQQTFDAYLRALEEAEARLESLNSQVLELAQTPAYAALVRALSCLKGIDTLSAVTIVVETQDFRRFPDARGYMKFTGLVCSEDSSGDKTRRGGITKAGNAHLRRVLVEAAWSYSHQNTTGPDNQEAAPRPPYRRGANRAASSGSASPQILAPGPSQ